MWCLLYPMGKNPWYTLKQKVIKNIQNIPLTFINYFSLHSTGRVQDRKELVILQANTKDVLYIHVTVHRNRFPFNSQPDALIIQIYSVIKLYMFQASSLPIIRSFPLYRMEQSSILTLLGSGHQNLHETYQCRTYGGKLLMMGKEDA